MRPIVFYFLCCFSLFLVTHVSYSQKVAVNPLLPAGADPWCLYKDGYYYYTHTTGKNITIWKTRDLHDLNKASKKIVFTPPVNQPYSKELWAPEIHFIQGKWWVYFAADSGRNEDHRLWVIENEASDPLKGEWKLKGKLKTPEDKWSIDGSVFELNHQLYLVWSGWEGNQNGRQDIFIAKMKNPWTVIGPRVKISSPELPWEMNGDIRGGDPSHVNVNEGPEILIHGDRLFLLYSASGCWTDQYALGMLSTTLSSDLLDPRSWKKSSKPVFQQSIENEVYAPGHCSFFKSPDGKSDYILYHANDQPGQGCGGFRSPRCQQFFWDQDGVPQFGIPVATQSAAMSEQPFHIFTLGDSNGTFPYSWPKQLNKLLPRADVFNISKSGRTIGFVNLGDSSLNSLLVLDENLRKAATYINDHSFDYIIIELGTNDAKAVFADRQSEVSAHMEQLIQQIKNSSYPSIQHAKIIIVSPPPYGIKADTIPKYAGGSKRVKDMSVVFEKIAKRNGCLFVNGYQTPGLDIDKMTPDGLHLDAIGSRKLMEIVAKLMLQAKASSQKNE